MAAPESNRPSSAALALGYLALVPFLAGAAATGWAPEGLRGLVGIALSVYAAVVVSFIGGIHWGLGFAESDPPASLFVWGVVPALVAWPAALLAPRLGLIVHAAMLLICFAVDRAVYPRHRAAAWLPLRLRLSVVAAVCCVVGALGSVGA